MTWSWEDDKETRRRERRDKRAERKARRKYKGEHRKDSPLASLRKKITRNRDENEW